LYAAVIIIINGRARTHVVEIISRLRWSERGRVSLLRTQHDSHECRVFAWTAFERGGGARHSAGRRKGPEGARRWHIRPNKRGRHGTWGHLFFRGWTIKRIKLVLLYYYACFFFLQSLVSVLIFFIIFDYGSPFIRWTQ